VKFRYKLLRVSVWTFIGVGFYFTDGWEPCAAYFIGQGLWDATGSAARRRWEKVQKREEDERGEVAKALTDAIEERGVEEIDGNKSYIRVYKVTGTNTVFAYEQWGPDKKWQRIVVEIGGKSINVHEDRDVCSITKLVNDHHRQTVAGNIRDDLDSSKTGVERMKEAVDAASTS
jgi:hypothetical protein